MVDDPSSSRRRWLMSIAAIGLLALGLAAFAGSSRQALLANFRVPGDFPEVFVDFKVNDPSRCLVTDRGGSTERRSEPVPAAARWHCAWRGDLLTTFDNERPSFIFVPSALIAAEGYLTSYEELRRSQVEKPLPRLRTVQLFVDRLFRGTFVQVSWPGQDFSQDQGVGRTEVLVVAGERLFCLDNRLRSICRDYAALIAEGIFPRPSRSPAIAALETRLPGELPRAFLLNQEQPEPLRPWPLPFDLPVLLGLESAYYDARIVQWLPGAQP